MIIVKKPETLQQFLEEKRLAKKTTGFTPTMGALHAGHLSLVNEAKKQNDIVVASIFVNPTQFNDAQDFKKYPITLEKDILLFENAGCDLLFLPSVQDVYPNGVSGLKHYDLGFLETILEGKFRPGHFQGVCQVMDRLLKIVLPDNLYLGQKDYQQCMVIKKLIGLIGLDKKIKVTICPTLREEDGLAMSSRNMRLNVEERQKAPSLYLALLMIMANLNVMPLENLKTIAVNFLMESGFKVDYVEAADADSLELVNNWDGRQKIVALAAAFLNDVRLIDNIGMNP